MARSVKKGPFFALKGSGIISFQQVAHFLSLIRFSHTVFALPFAALACVWAFAVPAPVIAWDLRLVVQRLIGVLVCMVAARSAAMAFNRWADVTYDARNPRTAGRHLPAGLLSKTQVTWFFVVCCVCFMAGTMLFWPNWLPVLLSGPVLAWICGYSYAKRFTSAAHLWLGIALALSPICAWIALRGEEVMNRPADILVALPLAVAIACWVAGFDIIYACQDADFDRRSGLHSMPARLGVRGALHVAAGFHLLMWLALAVMPWLLPQLNLGWLYFWALAGVAVLLLRQHWIVSPEDLTRVNEAFFTLNMLISFGLCLVAAVDAWV